MSMWCRCKEALEQAKVNAPGLIIRKPLGNYLYLLAEPHSAYLSISEEPHVTHDGDDRDSTLSLLGLRAQGVLKNRGVGGALRKKAQVRVH